MMRKSTSVAAIALTFFLYDDSQANANGWSSVIIARGDYPAKLESMPIEARPNRPFHFYGNSVRRAHKRAQSAARFDSV